MHATHRHKLQNSVSNESLSRTCFVCTPLPRAFATLTTTSREPEPNAAPTKPVAYHPQAVQLAVIRLEIPRVVTVEG